MKSFKIELKLLNLVHEKSSSSPEQGQTSNKLDKKKAMQIRVDFQHGNKQEFPLLLLRLLSTERQFQFYFSIFYMIR